jgi:hypothetical protein
MQVCRPSALLWRTFYCGMLQTVCCTLDARTRPRSAAAAELQLSEPAILQELLPTDATVTKVKRQGSHARRP